MAYGKPGAPIGNQNRKDKRHVKHERIAVSFSGKELDEIYEELALLGKKEDALHARQYVHEAMQKHLKERRAKRKEKAISDIP